MDKFLKIVFTVVLSVLLRFLNWGFSAACYILMAACFIPVWEKIVPEESKMIESDLLFLGIVGVFWLAVSFVIKPFLEKTLIIPLMRRANGQKKQSRSGYRPHRFWYSRLTEKVLKKAVFFYRLFIKINRLEFVFNVKS